LCRPSAPPDNARSAVIDSILRRLAGAVAGRYPAFAARVRDSPLGRRIATGTAWSVAGSLGARTLALAWTVVVVRLIGRAEYGQVAVIQNTVAMFAVFAGLGLGLTGTRQVARYRTQDPARTGRTIGLLLSVSIGAGALFAVALVAFGPWLAATTLDEPSLGPLLQISAALLLFGTVDGVLVGLLAGFEAFRAIARNEAAASAVTFVAILIGASTAGVVGIVAALIVGMAARTGLDAAAVVRITRAHGVRIQFAGSGTERRLLLDFSLPALMSSALLSPVQWICAAVLVNRPHGFEQLGVYNAAYQWRTLLLFVPHLVAQVLMPVMTERIAAGDTRGTRRALLAGIGAGAAVALPIGAALVLLAPQVMTLYGPGFEGGADALVLIAITGALIATIYPVGHLIAAADRMWLGFLMNLGWALATVALTLLWIDRGAEGLAAAQLAAYALHAVWTFGFAYLHLRGDR